MLATARQLEILDLRHFSSGALRPLLQEEAAVWERRLLWDYSYSIDLLLEYIDTRSLTGYVALRNGRVAGYAFGVCEAAKAVLGDVYAFGEGEQEQNPVCDQLLEHLLETMQATPGITRVESQLLLFPDHALETPLLARGLRSFPRLFMLCDLTAIPPALHTPADVQRAPEPWLPAFYNACATLIFEAYAGHTDSEINDQYRTLSGAQRFLHNIVHFPGCGVFDPANSWVLRDPRTGLLEGVVLCSRVRHDAAHITQLCVGPRARGRGLGGRLLSHCLDHLARQGTRTVSLTVTDSNHGARTLYERNGFRTLHRFEAWVWDKKPIGPK
jgi:ribosomal protein S18 acetylase RimI-like enzyme